MRHTGTQYLQWPYKLRTKMETSLKISIFLQFFSWAVCLNFFPPININTPVGFGFNIGSQKMFSDNSKNSRRFEPSGSAGALSECFCFPNHSERKLVTEHIQLKGQDLERLVVYFYRSNGLLQAFIPNKQKQIMIPDLSFDETDGDILKPIYLDPVVDIFDSNPSVVKKQNQIPANEVDETDTDTSNIESNSLSNVVDVPPADTEQETIHSETDNLSSEEEEMSQPAGSSSQIDENNMSIDENNMSLDENNIPLDENSMPLDENSMPLDENSMPLDENSMPLDENNVPHDENNVSVDENNMPFDENNVSLGENNMLLNDYDLGPDEQNEFVVATSRPLKENQPINISTSKDIKNLRVTDELYKIFSLLPLKARWYLKSLFPQLHHLNEGDQKDRHHITFDDWFKHEMTGIALENLPTSTDTNSLKRRIIKVLESNGMEVTSDGMLFDPHKNALKIANIKLRPILIGEPIQVQIKVDDQAGFKYVTSTEMSYVQIILVTLVNPPTILGVVPVGRVYLPRGVNRDQQPVLISHGDESEPRSGVTVAKVGCKTCKLRNQRKHHTLYSPLKGMPYFQLPLRKKINGVGPILMRKLPKIRQDLGRNSHTHNILSNGVDKNYFNNIMPKILGGFGTKKILGDETRHILSEKPIIIPRPIPQKYPNDNLPGFRIIGGNAATSSGTPLVSKGRSGYERF